MMFLHARAREKYCESKVGIKEEVVKVGPGLHNYARQRAQRHIFASFALCISLLIASS